MRNYKDYTELLSRIDTIGKKLGYEYLTDMGIDADNCSLKESDEKYWEEMINCALEAADSRLNDYESDYGIRKLLEA